MNTINPNFQPSIQSPFINQPQPTVQFPTSPPVTPPTETPPPVAPEQPQDESQVIQRDLATPLSSPDLSFEGRANTSTPSDIPRIEPVAPRDQDIDVEKMMKWTRRRVQLDLASHTISGTEYPLSDAQSRAVDFALADRGLDMSDTDAKARTVHQAVLTDTLLTEYGGEGYTSLSADQKSTVLKTLMLSDFNDLFTPEMQGRGGVAAGQGTADGAIGHYVNSEMASMLKLAEDGKLNDPALLGALETLHSGELEPHLDAERTDLISSALQNVAFPERISQHGKGTCAATVPEIMLASQKPGEYLSLVAQLATPEGQATLSNGTEFQREAGTEQTDNSGRSIASRLVQPAFMEYANGERSYDNTPAQGLHSDGGVGLPQTEASHLINGLFGEGSIKETLSTGGWDGSRKVDAEALVRTVAERAAAAGQATPVGITWQETSHELLVTQMDDDFAYMMNPHGELHKMPRDEFDERLKMASITADDFEINLPEVATYKINYTELEPSAYMNNDELKDETLAEVVENFAERLEPFDADLAKAIQAAIPNLDTATLDAIFTDLRPLVIDSEFEMLEDGETLKDNIRALLP